MNVFAIRHGETGRGALSGQHTGTTDHPADRQWPAACAERLRPVLAKERFALRLRQPAAAGTGDLRAGRSSAIAPSIDRDLVEWNYGDYEGLTPKQIAEDSAGLVDLPRRLPGRRDSRSRSARGWIGSIASDRGGIRGRCRAVRARPRAACAGGALDRPDRAAPGSTSCWIPGRLSVLGYYRDVPAMRIWNGRSQLARTSARQISTVCAIGTTDRLELSGQSAHAVTTWPTPAMMPGGRSDKPEQEDTPWRSR